MVQTSEHLLVVFVLLINNNINIMANYFKCIHCGNVVMKVVDMGVDIECCGDTMHPLKANTEEASVEKHLPVVTRIDESRIRVDVGSEPHPMSSEHHIAFIYVETAHGGIRIDLNDKPGAIVCLCHDKPIAVYAYCNLHGLWKTKV